MRIDDWEKHLKGDTMNIRNTKRDRMKHWQACEHIDRTLIINREGLDHAFDVN